MAASDHHQRSHSAPAGAEDASAPEALGERLREEIARAERHRTGLSCLLVALEDFAALAPEQGGELREQTIEYIEGALRRELRCYDRVGRTANGEVLVLLPGADSPRAEMVARRALARLRSIKVESGGARTPIQVSVGLSAWQEGVDARELVARARAALRRVNGNGDPARATAAMEPFERTAQTGAQTSSAGLQADPTANVGRTGRQ